jgi:hypothetical protein
MATVATILNEYGEALRHDWSDFDGRSARDDLNRIADQIRHRGNTTLDEAEARNLRNTVGICPDGRGHWQEHCDDGCDPTPNLNTTEGNHHGTAVQP